MPCVEHYVVAIVQIIITIKIAGSWFCIDVDVISCNNMFIKVFLKGLAKGKATPLQAWTGP
jgi:hypothetical protein